MRSTPEGLERVGLTVAVVVGLAVLVAAIGLALAQVSFLAGPLVVAAVVVIATDPVVGFLVDRGWRRGLAVFVVIFGGLGVLATAGFALAPLIWAQWQGIAESLPGLWADAEEWLLAWGEGLAIDVERLLVIGSDLIDDMPSGSGTAWGLGVVAVMVSLVLGLILGAAAVLDLPGFKRSARATVPHHFRDRASALARDAGRAVTGFIRGQMLIALIVGVLISVGLALLDVPFWLILGSIAGIGNLVPFLGPVVGGIPATFIALTTRGVGTALAAVLLMVVVQLIESYLLSPLILFRTVRVRPLVVILAILIGWSVFGFLGMLLAVPAAAVFKVAFAHGLSWVGMRSAPSFSTE